MTPITDAKFRAEVRRLADASPDYIYEAPRTLASDWVPACVYVHEGAPSCLIGQALASLGVPLATLETHDISQDTASQVLQAVAPETTGTTWAWAWDVQLGQDRGLPWAQAVADADLLEAL